MLLIILVMALGIALLGDFLAAFGIDYAIGGPIGQHCSTCPIKLEVNVIYTKQKEHW